MMKTINYLFNFETLVINEALFNQLFNKYLQQKKIVYRVQTFGISSLFISIQFELDQIVHDRPNIAVT
jgi:hypothetical protein